MAESVKHPTLDLGLGLDIRPGSSSPVLGSILGVEPTLNNNNNKKLMKKMRILIVCHY